MLPARRLRVPVLLLGALAALLMFAATAAAETRTGESASPAQIGGTSSPEATLVKASASYETTGGSIGFSVTTAAEPRTEQGGHPSTAKMEAGLLSAPECTLPALVSQHFTFPVFFIVNQYKEPTAEAELLESSSSGGPLGAAAKTVSGTNTTLSFASSAMANRSFNCALVTTTEGGAQSYLVFPISAPPSPPASPVSPAPPTPAPAAALSIGKLKPLKLAPGKWETVRVKVTNTGGTATGQGSLRVKAPKGVLVKPERQKLPVLGPGASWTVSVRVQLTEKAGPKSTLSLTGTASGVSGKASVVIESKT